MISSTENFAARRVYGHALIENAFNTRDSISNDLPNWSGLYQNTAETMVTLDKGS